FFSSRRRHTRFSRDWSSDVCSSDLGAARDVIQNHLLQLLALVAMEEPVSFDAPSLRAEKIKALSAVRLPRELSRHTARGQYAARSEERRVGPARKTGGFARQATENV